MVDRLLGAGAVLFGKTNVPLYLGDWQSFNAIYGTTNNPWDVTRAPGGSSGGSAAALAAGLTALEAGSDIGSSIRNPAHFCGVYGHKPTWGIVPRTGQALPWQQAAPVDIDVVGPLARTRGGSRPGAVDHGRPRPDRGGRLAAAAARAPSSKRLRDFKVALMLDTPDIAVDREVQDRLRALADFLRTAEGEGRRARAAGHRPARGVPRLHPAPARGDVGPPDRRRLRDEQRHRARPARPATRATAPGRCGRPSCPTATGSPSTRRATACALQWAEFFTRYDLLLCPVASTAAFPHDQKGERYDRTLTVNGTRVPVTDHLFWAGYTGAFFLPSTAAPCGFTPSGLPVGVQIVAPQYGDLTSLAFARLLEREFQGFVPPPGYA